MRNYINIALAIIVIAVIISSCHRAYNQYQQSPLPTAVWDTTAKEVKTQAVQKPDFDVARFVSLTDSLLSEIQGKSITLNYIIDTITAKREEVFRALLPSDTTFIRRYSFTPLQGDSRLHFWFVEVRYADTTEINKAFEKLHLKANQLDTTDFGPGLTYTNDYVIRTENKIYWLNTGCAFAFFNHQKMIQFLLGSLQIQNIQDSIWCQCGQPKCSL